MLFLQYRPVLTFRLRVVRAEMILEVIQYLCILLDLEGISPMSGIVWVIVASLDSTYTKDSWEYWDSSSLHTLLESIALIHSCSESLNIASR